MTGMRHVYQSFRPTCGASAYAMIVGISELEGVRECNTKLRGRDSGTHTHNVVAAFEKRGIKTTLINLPDHPHYDELFWLEPLSHHFPLYVTINRQQFGQRVDRHHAVAIAGGAIFDPNERKPVPISAYGYMVEKHATINSVLVVERELPGYGKRLELVA